MLDGDKSVIFRGEFMSQVDKFSYLEILLLSMVRWRFVLILSVVMHLVLETLIFKPTSAAYLPRRWR